MKKTQLNCLSKQAIYSSDTGAPLNEAAYEVDMIADQFCSHYNGENFDEQTWRWCSQCQQ